MTLETQAIIAVISSGLFVVCLFLLKKLPKRLKIDRFVNDWKDLQSFCKDRTTWPRALSDADKLLDNALKKRKFRGKSMGERLVSAQRSFTDNDGVWTAHNLSKKVLQGSIKSLREPDVKAALIAYRQALKDIGALPNGQSKNF